MTYNLLPRPRLCVYTNTVIGPLHSFYKYAITGSQYLILFYPKIMLLYINTLQTSFLLLHSSAIRPGGGGKKCKLRLGIISCRMREYLYWFIFLFIYISCHTIPHSRATPLSGSQGPKEGRERRKFDVVDI